MLKLQDIKIGDEIKINNFKGLGVKAMLIANSPIKEVYEVIAVEEKAVNNAIGAIAIEVEKLSDGRTIVGIIFETDLEYIELVK